MHKIIFGIIWIVILCGTIYLFVFYNTDANITIDSTSHDVHLSHNNVNCISESMERFGMEEEVYHFSLDESEAELSITIRTLKDSATIIFYNYKQGKDALFNIKIALPAMPNRKPLTEYEIQKEHNNVIGIDFLTLLSEYLFSDEKFALVSKQIFLEN